MPAPHRQLPADPRGQLLCFGTGQQVAEIERLEVLVFADPTALLDQFAVHQRDLPCGAAEAEEADARGDARQLGKTGMMERALRHYKYLRACRSRVMKATLGRPEMWSLIGRLLRPDARVLDRPADQGKFSQDSAGLLCSWT